MRCFALYYSILTMLSLQFSHADETFEYSAKAGGHIITIKMRKSAFILAKHKHEIKNSLSYIDGQLPIGTDGTFLAHEEINLLNVSWDNHKISIPKTFYTNIYDINLDKKTDPFGRSGSMLVVPNRNGDAVLIECTGGREAGSYRCWIVITRNGRLSKFVTSVGGDDFN